MLWKYFLFESKILIKNRKNWFLGIVIMLFFPLFVLYTNQTPAENLRDIKGQKQIRTVFCLSLMVTICNMERQKSERCMIS